MRWLVLLALLPACVLYSSDDDDVIECDDGDYVPYELLDPASLTCQDFGGYQCAESADLAVPIPSWGRCDSPCFELDEGTCYGASGCRVVYLNSFHGCYPVDQSGPIQGACENLGAYDCSQHDDCMALHDPFNLAFVSCVSENR